MAENTVRTQVKGPDGQMITVQHPAGASDESIIRYAQQQQPETPVQQGEFPESMRRAAEVKSLSDSYKNAPPFANRLGGVAETGLSFATGVPATIAAGLGGLGTILSGGGRDAAANRVSSIQDAMTYQPRTESGQQVMGAVSKPFEAYADFATERGNTALEGSGSPAYATAIKTGIEMLPAALGIKKGPKGRTEFTRRKDVAEAMRGADTVGLDITADALTQRGQLVNAAQDQIGQRTARGESMDSLVDAMKGEREVASQGVDTAYDAARDTNAAVRTSEMPQLIENINTRLESYDVATKPIVQRRISHPSFTLLASVCRFQSLRMCR